MTPDTEKGDIAVSPEVLEVFEVLKEGKSSSPETLPTVVEERELRQPTTATFPRLFQNEPLWHELEFLAGGGIDRGARMRIIEQLERQGFDLERFVVYFRRYPVNKKAQNAVGILIAKAERFGNEAAGFDFDDKPVSKGELAFRNHLQGELAELNTKYKCQVCQDTGRTEDKNLLRRSVKEPCSHCEAGQLARADDEAAIAEQCKAAGKCAQCYGRGYVNGDRCSSCSGSGETAV